jgi:hypothetical protein
MDASHPCGGTRRSLQDPRRFRPAEPAVSLLEDGHRERNSAVETGWCQASSISTSTMSHDGAVEGTDSTSPHGSNA